jgi:UDP-N-acetyl-2-amino-2-deoxyglucuronate dehydrogenase
MSIRIGLVGGGNISNTHARAASEIPGVEIVAIYGTNEEKVSRLSQEFRAKSYSDVKSFLAHSPMEAVIIGSPSGLHAEQGIAAAQHKLHVLTEKPIDVTTGQADALISACKRAGVKLGVIFQDRFKPDILRLKKFLDAGSLGKPLLIDARVKWYRPPEYYHDSKWRGTLALDGGGALMNQGIHTVDLLIWLFGGVAKVQARTATLLHDIESEDTALALLEFASGAIGMLQATTAAYPGYARRVEITGSEGTVILEQDRIVAADLRNKDDSLISADTGDQNPSASSPVVSDVRGHRCAIEDFIHAIESNGTPVCDGEDGRRSLALVEAIYESAGFIRKRMQRAI